jgi:hypothetical protein
VRVWGLVHEREGVSGWVDVGVGVPAGMLAGVCMHGVGLARAGVTLQRALQAECAVCSAGTSWHKQLRTRCTWHQPQELT